MAEIDRHVRGQSFEKFLARLDGVQDYLEALTFAMAARAEVLLIEHRFSGNAAIETVHGDINWYLVLTDELGQKHALSIEYGRVAGTDPKTGRRWGDMDGLFILHQATNLPKKRKPKVRFPGRRRR